MDDVYTDRFEVVSACAAACNLAPRAFPPDLPTTPLLRGAPDWYPFEHQAWEIGERIRQSLQRRPRFKRDALVREAIMKVVACRHLRRGRQSFVMALGFAAAHPDAAQLALFLADPDIHGQVVDTLLRMRAGQFVSLVAPLRASKYSWIRRLAKRYCDRYEAVA
jgi:hypothetical protein